MIKRQQCCQDVPKYQGANFWTFFLFHFPINQQKDLSQQWAVIFKYVFVRFKPKLGFRVLIGGHIGNAMLYIPQKEFQYKFCISCQRQNCSSTKHVTSVLLEVAIGGQWGLDMCLKPWHKMYTSSERVVDLPSPPTPQTNRRQSTYQECASAVRSPD